MTLSRRVLALVCATAALGAAALGTPPALAAGNAIINDCQANGQLTHPYTVRELRHALAVMPASVKQYTSCFDVVQNALVSARKHKGTAPASGGKGGGSSFLPTPVIVILVLLILAALTFGALATRRRRAGPRDGHDLDEASGEAPTRLDEPPGEAPMRRDEPSGGPPMRGDERPEDEREGGRP
jgi:hypothetical protein